MGRGWSQLAVLVCILAVLWYQRPVLKRSTRSSGQPKEEAEEEEKEKEEEEEEKEKEEEQQEEQEMNQRNHEQTFGRDVHTFLYMWYGNPDVDGQWLHWNHQVIPHWNERLRSNFPSGMHHQPPEDIGAAYYPLRGLYSSKESTVLDEQLAELRDHGVNVVIASWWGRATNAHSVDGEGCEVDSVVWPLLHAAERQGVAVCFHLEPYAGRSALSVADDVRYIMDSYSTSTALYRDSTRKNQTLFYVFDSYHISSTAWATILREEGDTSLRNGPYDATFLGLVIDQKGQRDIVDGGFDGFYTYFATDGFTYGATTRNWEALATFARKHELLFSLSVAPGYDDRRIRPWNAVNTRERMTGQYFAGMWEKALLARPSFVSITSYNEWGEGTQIEPAVRKTSTNYTYPGYGADDTDDDPFFYLRVTKEWVTRFHASRDNDRKTAL